MGSLGSEAMNLIRIAQEKGFVNEEYMEEIEEDIP